MPVVVAEPAYETVGEARETRLLKAPAKTVRYAKVAAKFALAGLGVALLAVAWLRRGPAAGPASRPALGGKVDDVALDFQVRNVPGDCKEMMRFNGCEKKRWTCLDKDNDYSPEFRCCCEESIWHTPYRPPTPPLALVHKRNSVSVLRLQKSTDICLAGPEDFGDNFRLTPCGKSNTRFKLPPRGAGIIELVDQPGSCLGVAKGSLKHVEVVPCNHGSQKQMFQLTNGDKGMLQWSHGGNKCLDSENESTDSGSKMVLADCVYWPMKPSQVFVLEDAPKTGDNEEKEEEKEVVHPSLFCASLMLPWSYEVDMMRSHLKHKVGIFACTAWAVFSNERVKLKDGSDTAEEDVFCDVMSGSLKAKIGGKFHTALNTPVFVRFWKKLIADGRAFHYDWTVKADPDCVFFPDRLTEMLKNRFHPHGTSGDAVWLNNCQLGMHGPIEVFNKAAFQAYKDGNGACDSVAEKHGQEDVFLRKCFETLGVPKVDAFNLLLEAEWACNERPSAISQMPPCYDQQVSFHPFKSVESYFKCYNKAKKMSWSSPLVMKSAPPTKANHHHDS